MLSASMKYAHTFFFKLNKTDIMHTQVVVFWIVGKICIVHSYEYSDLANIFVIAC